MGLFDKHYMNKYYEIRSKIDSLNERNRQGYQTLGEYVLSDETMIKYFYELKKVDRKLKSLEVDDEETFYNHVFNQLNDIYQKCVDAIKRGDKTRFSYNDFNDLEQDILGSFGHGCDSQLRVLYNDLQNRKEVTNKVETNEDYQAESVQGYEDDDDYPITSYEKIEEDKKDFFSLEINNWLEKTNVKYDFEYECYDKNCCPLCGVVLEKKVSASKKCPACKKKFFIKTNKISKRKLLMSPEKYIQFNQDLEKLDEILFMNKQIDILRNIYPKYLYKLYEMRKEKYTSISPRDYTWSYENWLMNELDNEGYKALMRAKSMDFEDRVYEGDKAYSLFKSANEVYFRMAEVAKYKGQTEIYINILMGILYRNVIIANLPYTYWEDKPFSEEDFEYNVTLYMYYVAELFYLNDMTIDELKNEFLSRRSQFILSLVERDVAWESIQEHFINYLKSWDYREGKYETIDIEPENDEFIIGNIEMKDCNYEDGFFFCRLNYDSHTTQNYFIKYKDYKFRDLVFAFYNRNGENVYEQIVHHNNFFDEEYKDHNVEHIFAHHMDNIVYAKLRKIILKKELTKQEMLQDDEWIDEDMD